jgi:hypothetical protein
MTLNLYHVFLHDGELHMVFGYCEHHWRLQGQPAFESDPGPKRHMTKDVTDATVFCDECRLRKRES